MGRQKQRTTLLQQTVELPEHALDGNGCWVCLKAYSSNGYPYMRRNGKQQTVARWAYENKFGPIEKGQVLRHKCDNKGCINPDHMMLGSTKDNVRDAHERGLAPKGATHGMSKILVDDVRAMQLLNQNGFTSSWIARLFRLNKSTVARILNGKHWTIT
jgi:hypothetical protein